MSALWGIEFWCAAYLRQIKLLEGLLFLIRAKEKPQRGEVVATGKGKALEGGNVAPLEVKVKDKILFSKYSGTELKLESEDFLMMREEDVLGIIN